jgi:hypothetical protein
VHGPYELARKIERKKMSIRDEKRHLDVKREVNFRRSALIDRYWTHYGVKKRSASREKSMLEGIRSDLGRSFVREIDGNAVSRWYENLTAVHDLSAGTAVRHFNVMHRMMERPRQSGPGKPASTGIPRIRLRSGGPTTSGIATSPKTSFGD